MVSTAILCFVACITWLGCSVHGSVVAIAFRALLLLFLTAILGLGVGGLVDVEVIVLVGHCRQPKTLSIGNEEIEILC